MNNAAPKMNPTQTGPRPGPNSFKPAPLNTTGKSFVTTLLLCIFLGGLGVHRFYVGKVVSGIFMMLTLGGFGLWALVDMIMIVMGKFSDSAGRPLRH